MWIVALRICLRYITCQRILLLVSSRPFMPRSLKSRSRRVLPGSSVGDKRPPQPPGSPPSCSFICFDRFFLGQDQSIDDQADARSQSLFLTCIIDCILLYSALPYCRSSVKNWLYDAYSRLNTCYCVPKQNLKGGSVWLAARSSLPHH